jgi:von Willebrand factor A domain-containing protein 5
MFRCLCCIRRNQKLPSSQIHPIPLVSVNFSAIIHNSLCTLTILQQFQNKERNPIECDYSFPTSDDSVITSLKIHLADGTILNAKVEESELALETYQDAISEGNTAVIGKMETVDRMNILIGNLQPGECVSTEIVLTFQLAADEDKWKLAIPAGFIPSDPESFAVLVAIYSSAQICSYESNCGLAFERSPDGMTLQGNVENRSFKLNNRVLWVRYKAENTTTLNCIYQRVGQKTAAMLSFIPYVDENTCIDDAESTGEYIFVLDRSGSMQGERIKLAKEAAILFLKSLPMGSKYNIISFGGNFTAMHKKSEVNSSASVARAVTLINKFEANMGGTNIYSPLSEIFCTKPEIDYPRTIFLLTDGQVNNPEAIVQLIQGNSNNCRVNGFGIGNDVDTSLIKRAAKAGGGSAHFITNAQEIGKKVITALKSCIFPCTNHWENNWPGESYPMPSQMGNIYYGEKFVQFIMMDSLPNTTPTVKYFDSLSKQFIEVVTSNFTEINGDQIFKLWAKKKIDYLCQEAESNKSEIIEVSKNFGIPSEFTSFICVKENENPTVGDMQTRKVPIRQARERPLVRNEGFRVFKGVAKLARAMPRSSQLNNDTKTLKKCKPQTSIKCTSSLSTASYKSLESKPMKKQMIVHRAEAAELDYEEEEEEVKEVKIKGVKKESARKRETLDSHAEVNYMNLIALQQSEGFWIYSEVERVMKGIRNIPNNIVEAEDISNVIATLAVLGHLHKKCIEKYDEWVLVEKKALKWLRAKKIQFADLKDDLLKFI